MSTSQLTRAISFMCVPVILADEPRDLPFGRILNYKSFSIVLSIAAAFKRGWARKLVQRLNVMTRTGEYNRMYSELADVKSFFNYFEFGSRSPYALALLDMQIDSLDKAKNLWNGKRENK